MIKDEEDTEDIPAMSFWRVFCIPGVMQFAMSFFFIKFAYYGVYYWVPTYLEEELKYTKDQTTDILSLGSTGGMLGSILSGLVSDLVVLRTPVHLLDCLVGALCLSCLTAITNNQHQGLLTFMLTAFSVFENGATIVIGIVECDIGKEILKTQRLKTIATISGLCDGIAGFGSILGQILLGPVQDNYGWQACFAMFSLAAWLACLPTIPYTIRDVIRFYREKRLVKAQEKVAGHKVMDEDY